jgi:hypothetical protein
VPESGTETDSTGRSTRARWLARLPALWVTAVAALHLAALIHYGAPVLNSPDANGYYVPAARLASHGTLELGVESPLQYIGNQWLDVGDGRFYSKYAPGIPVLLAPVYALFGPDAALSLTPLLASLSLLLIFGIARGHVEAWLAAAGATLYALQPIANVHAQNWGSHTQASFMLLTGLWLLQRWARQPSLWLATATGVALGAVPAIRPAESVVAIGVCVFVALTVRQDGRWRSAHLQSLLAMAGGALVPIGLLAYYDSVAFGDPLSTGYALTGEQQLGSAFSSQFLLDKWRPVLESLATDGAGLSFGLGLMGLAGMLAGRGSRATGALWLCIVAAMTLLYTSYYWGGGGDGQTPALRLLIPTLPLYLLPALWLLERAGRDRRERTWLVAGLVLVQGTLWGTQTLDDMRRTRALLRPLHDILVALREQVPADGVLIVDPRLAECLQYEARWLVLDASVVLGNHTRPMQTLGNVLFASPVQPRKAQALRAELDRSGYAARIQRVRRELKAVGAHHAGGVYWLIPEPVRSHVHNLDQAIAWSEVSRVFVPRLASEVFLVGGRLPDGSRAEIRRPLPGERVAVLEHETTYLLLRARLDGAAR